MEIIGLLKLGEPIGAGGRPGAAVAFVHKYQIEIAVIAEFAATELAERQEHESGHPP